jgi:hypothetical protein
LGAAALGILAPPDFFRPPPAGLIGLKEQKFGGDKQILRTRPSDQEVGQLEQVCNFERRFWSVLLDRYASNVKLYKECISDSTKSLCKSKQSVAPDRCNFGLHSRDSFFALDI